MKKFLGLPVLSLVAMFASVSAQAGIVLIDSQAGLTSSAGTTVAIDAHPSWQTNNPDGSAAVWIAHQDSGYQGSEFVPTGTTVDFFHSFTSGAGYLDMKVWADDTTGVFIQSNGGAWELLYAASPNPNSTCSTNPIGCLPDNFGAINHLLVAGDHTLKFVVSQVGTGADTTSNPFGLLYTGTAPGAAETPEPAAFLLTGAGLVGVGILRRRMTAK